MSMFHVRRSRAIRVLTGAALAIPSACLPAARELAQHPRPLAGDWIDPKHTTAADTSVWRLAPSGADLTVHVRPTVAGAPATRIARHGIWFLRGTLGDSVGRALCFNRRPGRNPSWCVPFALDTLGDGRLRLTIRSYRGTHDTTTRVLEERRP